MRIWFYILKLYYKKGRIEDKIARRVELCGFIKLKSNENH